MLSEAEKGGGSKSFGGKDCQQASCVQSRKDGWPGSGGGLEKGHVFVTFLLNVEKRSFIIINLQFKDCTLHVNYCSYFINGSFLGVLFSVRALQELTSSASAKSVSPNRISSSTDVL